MKYNIESVDVDDCEVTFLSNGETLSFQSFEITGKGPAFFHARTYEDYLAEYPEQIKYYDDDFDD